MAHALAFAGDRYVIMALSLSLSLFKLFIDNR